MCYTVQFIPFADFLPARSEYRKFCHEILAL